ncbi:MAG: tetratricopeptide repeat protein [Bacteroidales bacterium]|nr:tetratricopeptide repeat protein [Bacteroidales bacterium]
MKNTLKMMLFALLAFGMLACGEKKLTEDDMKAAEASLFNEDKTMNEALAPEVAQKYAKFAEQNPDAESAPLWLYHAMEINVQLKNAEKSAELCDKLLEKFPQSEWAPRSLFLLGSFVYNDQLNDTAQAHATLQRLIDEYPESELVDDAQKSIEYLGLTPEEIMNLILMSSFEEEEEDNI